ncbi:Uma2 family endonuclease [Actinoplanes missouriensis]|uniref:Uma2 family endonuclease n=1 Tax=Actinoplanes missouriensis TaxID=1866 RepID=UPI0033EEE3C0
MTAEPAGQVMWSPDPVRQRRRDFTIEDVLKFPDDAPRVELDDGVVVVVPKPSLDHNDIANLVWWWLRQNAPEEFRPGTEVGVAAGFRTSLEPDVLLLRQPVVSRHFYDPAQVELVVEVVSPGSRRRDRFEKPELYARAGVRHHWRIEQDPVHIYAYDLVSGAYELVADADEELVLSAPFEIRLPIRDITP